MYTKEDIIKQLEIMGAPRGVPVIVHSAYSRVGEVAGGCEAFLDALIEYFTADGGLLLIPAHTWDLIGRREVTLDMTDRYTNLGYLSRVALADTRGVRTEHPTHSAVIFGEGAYEYAEGEKYVCTPTSPEGCYGKLYTMGGAVLLVGVTQTSNTYLHAVDEILGIPGRVENCFSEFKIKRCNGEIVSRKIQMFDELGGDISLRFDKLADAFYHRGAARQGRLCDAETLICDAVKQKETLELIYSRSGGGDVLKNGDVIAEEMYK